MAITPKFAEKRVTLTVTSKGQVTLRKDVLRHLGVSQGDQLEFSKLPDGRLEIRAVRPGGGIERAFGLLAEGNGKRASLKEIAAADATDPVGQR